MAVTQIFSIIGLKLKISEADPYFKPFERTLSTYSKIKESVILLLF